MLSSKTPVTRVRHVAGKIEFANRRGGGRRGERRVNPNRMQIKGETRGYLNYQFTGTGCLKVMSTQKCGLTLIAARLEKVTSGDVWTVPVPGASLKTLFLPFSEHSGTLIEFKYLGVEVPVIVCST